MKYNSTTARGNKFNKTALNHYSINELCLRLNNGRNVRLDSYVPPKLDVNGNLIEEGEIISRKATDLTDISEITFRKHLQETKDEYAHGTKIHSNKFPKLEKNIR